MGVPSVREGEIVAGKYRIDRVLGAGGMGVVVAAHHLRLDERVAIKFLRPELLECGDAVARFEREARAAVKIKSEHVARVSDVGTLENGVPYMVMEFLEGSDLARALRESGPMPVEVAVEFVLQACEALAEAHSLGIVHRDLKPSNLFVIRRRDRTLSVKILDFGISKMRSSASTGDVSITKSDSAMGSPLYMSPEQMESAKDADQRTDIWALGLILYELVTGQSPFRGGTIPEVIAKILSTSPAPMRALRPTVPEGLERVVSRCLARKRDERFPSIAELAQALAPFAPRRANGSIERISRVLAGSGASVTTTHTAPRRLQVISIALAVASIFGAAAFVIVRHARTRDVTSPPTTVSEKPTISEILVPTTALVTDPTDEPSAAATEQAKAPPPSPNPAPVRLPHDSRKERHPSAIQAPQKSSSPLSHAPEVPSQPAPPARPAPDAFDDRK